MTRAVLVTLLVAASPAISAIAEAAPPSAKAPLTLTPAQKAKVAALAAELPEKQRAGWIATTQALLREWARGDATELTLMLSTLERAFKAKVAESGAPPPSPPEGKAIGVSLVIDVSGSMGQPAQGESGGEDKIVGAWRAANAALDRLKGAASTAKASIYASVLTFSDDVQTALPLRKVDASYPRLKKLKVVNATAIGKGMVAAREQLLAGGLKHQHIIVITDGQNSRSVSPLTVLRAFNLLPKDRFPRVHFVAFDVSSGIFKPLKLFLSKIHQANDGKQLDKVLAGLFSTDILAEAR